jgi:type II secretion system protein G
MRNNRLVRRGFTLIEILIVVVILGILAAIVIPQFTNASQEAAESSVKSQLQTVRSQVELFRVRNNGNLPTDFNDLLTPPNGEDPYLQKTPILPTGYDFVWGDNAASPNIETVYVTFTGGTLPEGLTVEEIEGW